jgi:putative transposase
MLAADFHLDCALTLQRLYCLFIMEAGSRHVHILGITASPDGPRTTQQICNLLIALGDRATASGSWSVTAPGSSPNPSTRSWPAPASTRWRSRPGAPGNAYAERFVLTVRTEVTDRMLIFSERHLRSVLAQYARHYNGRWPHRSRQLRPPRLDHPVADLSPQRIKRQPVLGALVTEYERAA